MCDSRVIADMQNMTLNWGDEPEAKKPVAKKPEEPQMAVSASPITDDELRGLYESLKTESQQDKIKILKVVLASIGEGNKPLPAAPAPSAPPAPRATYAEKLGDKCAKEAARPVPSAPAKAGKVCPSFGDRCNFGENCKHKIPKKSTPVMYDGKLYDKDAPECDHDGRVHPYCFRAVTGTCFFAHLVHPDGSLVNTGK